MTPKHTGGAGQQDSRTHNNNPQKGILRKEREGCGLVPEPSYFFVAPWVACVVVCQDLTRFQGVETFDTLCGHAANHPKRMI